IFFGLIFGSIYLCAMEKPVIQPPLSLLEASAEQIAKNIYADPKQNEVVKARVPKEVYERVNKYYFLLYEKHLDPSIQFPLSIDDLLRYKKLISKEEQTTGGLKLILSNNQITALEGLETIPGIEKFSSIDLSGNRIGAINKDQF